MLIIRAISIKLGSGCRLQNEKLVSGVEIPANSTATFYIPAAKADAITKRGIAIAKLNDIQVVGTDKGYVQVTVGSGTIVSK